MIKVEYVLKRFKRLNSDWLIFKEFIEQKSENMGKQSDSVYSAHEF